MSELERYLAGESAERDDSWPVIVAVVLLFLAVVTAIL
jgi:hypothetical protein